MEPSGPFQACNGTALPLPLPYQLFYLRSIRLHIYLTRVFRRSCKRIIFSFPHCTFYNARFPSSAALQLRPSLLWVVTRRRLLGVVPTFWGRPIGVIFKGHALPLKTGPIGCPETKTTPTCTCICVSSDHGTHRKSTTMCNVFI
jgi:hypothetical protein